MARTTRFHLDECCDNALAAGLRRRSIDVSTSPEAGLRGVDDREQAAYGLAENRVIVTHDADFLRIHASGVPHAGIAYRAKDTLSLGELIQQLVLIWEVYEQEEMTERVEFLSSCPVPWPAPSPDLPSPVSSTTSDWRNKTTSSTKESPKVTSARR